MMEFIFKVYIWNFSCYMMRSFAFIVENITSECDSVTPMWTFKYLKNSMPKPCNTDINKLLHRPLLCWYETSGADGNQLILGKAFVIQRYEIYQYFEMGPRQNWFNSLFLRRWSLWCSTDSCGQLSFVTFWLFIFISAYRSIKHRILRTLLTLDYIY